MFEWLWKRLKLDFYTVYTKIKRWPKGKFQMFGSKLSIVKNAFKVSMWKKRQQQINVWRKWMTEMTDSLTDWLNATWTWKCANDPFWLDWSSFLINLLWKTSYYSIWFKFLLLWFRMHKCISKLYRKRLNCTLCWCPSEEMLIVSCILHIIIKQRTYKNQQMNCVQSAHTLIQQIDSNLLQMFRAGKYTIRLWLIN